MVCSGNILSSCPRMDSCGGCIYQGVAYEDQLKEKAGTVKGSLKLAGLETELLSGIEACPNMYGYRNKMEYTFGDEFKGGPLELGMHKRKNFMAVVNAGQCQIVPEDFNVILNAALEFCRDRGYSFYHKKSHTGLLRSLIIRQGVRTNSLLVNIVTTSELQFDTEAFKTLVLSLSIKSHIAGILRTVNDNIADAVICDRLDVLYGQPFYMEEVLGLKFKVGAFSFFQTNVPAAERLYKEALELIPDIEGKTVYDLYCGTGTISQAMALKARRVYGVELVAEAVAAASENAALNGLENCKFICGDVLTALDDIEEKPDVIVVDPPRGGIHPKAMEKILTYGISQILYISCNPKTMAVNVAAAALYGYDVTHLKAYDNFPFTAHTEAVCLLEKKEI